MFDYYIKKSINKEYKAQWSMFRQVHISHTIYKVGLICYFIYLVFMDSCQLSTYAKTFEEEESEKKKDMLSLCNKTAFEGFNNSAY